MLRSLYSTRIRPTMALPSGCVAIGRFAASLVALGTICDVVPLAGLNRALVAQGLRVAARAANPGLAALARAARLAWPPTAEHCAFALGPRLNAGHSPQPDHTGHQRHPAYRQ